MRPLFILTTLSVLLTSCQDEFLIEDNPTPQVNTQVDSRLQPYFREFENLGQRFGYNFDLDDLGITGVIEHIQEQGVAGTCQYGSHIAHVTVDEQYWQNSSYFMKEMVVFHELGHCVLNRGHYEGSFSNGVCQSIMHSGTGDCNLVYQGSTRDYYIEELFANFSP